MWWLRRMTTVAVPYGGRAGSAAWIARAVSQTPGSRRPSQVRPGPVSGTTVRLAGRAHAAGFEVGQVVGQEGQPVRGVAEQVGLDQDLADQAGPVGVEPAATSRRAANSIRACGWWRGSGISVAPVRTCARAAARVG